MAQSDRPKRQLNEQQLASLARGRASLAEKRASGTLGSARGARGATGSDDGAIPIIEPRDIDGRNSGSGTADSSGTDSGASGSGGIFGRIFGSSGGSEKRKPGRPPGKKAALDLSHSEGLIDWMFLMVAGSLGPHWKLDEDEARRLNVAINNVARHFAVFESERSRDIGMLMIVAAQIAGPRAFITLTQGRPQRHAQGPAQPAAVAPSANGAAPFVQTPSQLDPASMAVSHATTGTA